MSQYTKHCTENKILPQAFVALTFISEKCGGGRAMLFSWPHIHRMDTIVIILVCHYCFFHTTEATQHLIAHLAGRTAANVVDEHNGCCVWL